MKTLVGLFLFGFSIWFWLHEFAVLMSMKDSEFKHPGYRGIWFLVILCGFVLGAFIFWLWRESKRDYGSS